MKIILKLFAQYRDGRKKEEEMEIEDGSIASDVIEKTGLDTERFPVGIVLVNGKHAEITHRLTDGETLSLFPKVGGG